MVLSIIFAGFVALLIILHLVGVSKADEAQAKVKALADLRAAAVAKALVGESDFEATHHIYGVALEGSVAIDEQQRLVCLVDGRRGGLRRMVYPHDKLIDVALVEDGSTITETRANRGSQLTGALVGGVLFGGAGAIIGGLSGSRVGTSSEVSQGLDLRITVDDLSYPVWTVPFLRGAMVKNTPRYRAVRDQAVQWQGLISILIRRADTERAAGPMLADVAAPLALPNSVATFHVCRSGHDIGAMPLSRIHALLEAGKLSHHDDLYFDPQLSEWVSLDLLPA